MAAKDFTELIAWQRADALERFALEMIKRPVLAQDTTFCEQTSDAAASAPLEPLNQGVQGLAPSCEYGFAREDFDTNREKQRVQDEASERSQKEPGWRDDEAGHQLSDEDGGDGKDDQ